MKMFLIAGATATAAPAAAQSAAPADPHAGHLMSGGAHAGHGPNHN